MTTINALAIIAALTTPKFNPKDPVKVLEGKYQGCVGTVIDVYQPPGDNLYDLGLTKCPNMWIKGTYTVEGIPESIITNLP